MYITSYLPGINRKNKQHVQYPNVPSAMKPVPHGPEIAIPKPPCAILESSSPSSNEDNDDISSTFEYNDNDSQNVPVPLNQFELNDLTRDLCLSKESAQLLGSRLREKNLLAQETTFYWYRTREKEFT